MPRTSGPPSGWGFAVRFSVILLLWGASPAARAAGDSSTAEATRAEADLNQANRDLRKKAAEAASLIMGIDRLAQATQQSAPPASPGLAKLRSWLTLKPSKNNPGGLYWRLAEVHSALGETNASASFNAAMSRHAGLTKTGSRAYQISADALKAADQVDKDLKPAVAALWARNDKPSALSLDNFRKEAVAGLKKVGGLMGQGVEAQGKAQARHLLALAQASPADPCSPPSAKQCEDKSAQDDRDCTKQFASSAGKLGKCLDDSFDNMQKCLAESNKPLPDSCKKPPVKPPAPKPEPPKPAPKTLTPEAKKQIFGFITEREGGQKNTLYVVDPKNPNKFPNSGITAGSGIDLSYQKAIISKLPPSSKLRKKLLPYTDPKLRGVAAKRFLDKKENKLTLSQAEVDELDQMVLGATLSHTIKIYNSKPKGPTFEELPIEAQKAITSVKHQYPNGAPKFTTAVKEQRWKDAVKLLRNFGDGKPFAPRHKAEADELQKAIDRGALK